MKKMIELIKKKALRDTAITILVIVILIACFIGINLLVQSFNLSPIDVTKEKLYSLSDKSKEKVKQIEQEIQIYLFGYTEESSLYNLINQYTAVNSKITVEAVTATSRPDLATLYGVDSDDQTGVVIQGTSQYKVLSENDFYTYDTTTGETIDLTEQKLTNSMIDIVTEDKPQIYFLTGHDEYSISTYLYSIGVYLQNEVNDVYELDLLSKSIPEDCDVIVIATPQKDFSEYETELLIEYINNGGDLLWLNDPDLAETEYPNIQKILDLYGVSFGRGIIIEQDSANMLLDNPEFIKPTVAYHTITKDIYNGSGIMFIDAGRIEIADTDMLEELNVTSVPFIRSGENSFYRKDLSISTVSKTDDDEEGSQVLGAELTKTVSDGKESKLVVYANNLFATSSKLNTGNYTVTAVELYNNKDLVLNTVAYLAGKEDAITIRKDTGDVTYTATAQEDTVIRVIIFAIPVVILVVGIVIWQVRRRKK